MKKYLIALILFLVLFLFDPKNIFALSRIAPQESSLIGQNHYYSVFLRGNGEAVVSFKAQFTNNGADPVYEASYYLPDAISVNNLTAYQVTNSYSTPCYPSGYDKPSVPEQDNETNRRKPFVSPATSSISSPAPDALTMMPCVDRSYYYGGYGNTYEKADYEISGNQLKIYFPTKVQVSESVELLLSFRTFGFVKKGLFGVSNYIVSTLSSTSAIDSIQLGLSTDPEYVFRDAKGNVNYVTAVGKGALPQALDMQMSAANPEFDTYYNSIGQGIIYKYSSHLAAGESYTIKGAYADSIWKLYIMHILIGIFIFITIVALIVFLLKKLFHKSGDSEKSHKEIRFWQKLTEAQKILVTALGLSIFSAFCINLYTGFLYFILIHIAPRLFRGETDFGPIFALLLVVISCGIYAAFLFLPALIIALKRSIGWGVATFVLTISVLILCVIIVTMVATFVFKPYQEVRPFYPQVIPGETRVQDLPIPQSQ